MKNYMIALAVLAFMLTACKTKNNDDHGHDHDDNIHQHEDGAVHEHENEIPAGQEEFNVDTLKQNIEEQIQDQHEHDNGEKHSHN